MMRQTANLRNRDDCAPRLWLPKADHVLGHSLFDDLVDQHGQFGYNLRCIPGRILWRHAANQITGLRFNGWSTGLALPRLPFPIQSESLPVPLDDRFGLDDGTMVTARSNRREFLKASARLSPCLGLATLSGARLMGAEKEPLYRIALAESSLRSSIPAGRMDHLDFAAFARPRQFDARGNDTEIDFRRMMKVVVDSGYRGYVGIEYSSQQADTEINGIRMTKRLLEEVREELF